MSLLRKYNLATGQYEDGLLNQEDAATGVLSDELVKVGADGTPGYLSSDWFKTDTGVISPVNAETVTDSQYFGTDGSGNKGFHNIPQPDLSTKLDKDFTGFHDKATLADSDLLVINDSEESYTEKKTLWSTFKTSLKALFDGLYAAIGHTHTGLLPAGVNTNTLRNVDGTWTADSALKISKATGIYPITLAFNGTTNATSNPSALFYLEKKVNTNNVNAIIQARLNDSYNATGAFYGESLVASNLSGKTPICFRASVGSGYQGILFYGAVGTGRADQPLVYLCAGSDTAYLVQYYSSFSTCSYSIKKDGTIMSNSLTASKPLKTNANKELVSGDFGTTAGTFAEGNHTHAATSWFKSKAANQTVTNSTNLVDDADLTFSAVAAAKYLVELDLILYQNNETADFKFKILVPTNAVAQGCINFANNGVLNSAIEANTNNVDLTAVQVLTTTDIGGDMYYKVHINAVVETVDTAGTVKLQWAQNTARAANTTLYKYSNMKVFKI